MRAWTVDAAGEPRAVLREQEVADPVPGAGELLVAVEGAGIGLPDVLMCRGTYPLTPGRPFVPGQEAVGRVVALGDGTDEGFRVGDRVLGVTAFYRGAGGFAERTIIPARTAWDAPEELTTGEAAGFVIPYHTAWIGLVERGGLQRGDRVLVLGAGGGSGAAAVDLAAALGADVVAVANGDAKAELCRRLGARKVVPSDAAGLPQAIGDAADGSGPWLADLVYDPVGAELADASLSCMRRGGRLLAVGFAGGRWATPDPGRLVRGNLSHVGVYTGGYERPELARMHAALLGLRRDGGLTPQATVTGGFAALPDLVEVVASRSAVGKLVWSP